MDILTTTMRIVYTVEVKRNKQNKDETKSIKKKDEAYPKDRY